LNMNFRNTLAPVRQFGQWIEAENGVSSP